MKGHLDMNRTGTSHLCPTLQKTLKLFMLAISWLVIFYVGYMSNLKKRTSTEVTSTVTPTVPMELESALPMYPYLIEEADKCAGRPPFLLLLIPSLPQEASVRDTLRKTWANESLVEGVIITRLFLLGMPNSNATTDEVTQGSVKRESSTHRDIIQQDFMDTYYNLTLKTLMGMQWASRRCPNASYVMKIDSDMFFNPLFLVHQILHPESAAKVGFFTGYVVVGSPPFREKDSKWYVPWEVYSKKRYPPYCSGTGYVFSGELTGRIYNQAHLLTIFPFEDVFVGLCLEKMGLQLSRPAGNWFVGERVEYNRCQFAKLVTVHHYKPDELLKIWPDFLKAGTSCPG
ncbi:beta-1,3-galactosyltransferase 5-like isoform X2 [Ascaphus truei]|uniref:beta-1,3-galactosyltransferase 5-like isoform X2 n=1 Tax=Ascaphus truei TaxID=8439 RepID=UPI003F593CA8